MTTVASTLPAYSPQSTSLPQDQPPAAAPLLCIGRGLYLTNSVDLADLAVYRSQSTVRSSGDRSPAGLAGQHVPGEPAACFPGSDSTGMPARLAGHTAYPPPSPALRMCV